MSLDLTSFNAMLKVRYCEPGAIEDLTYPKNKALALIPKDEKDGGDSFVQPVIVGDPQNTSADFTTAMAGTATSYTKKFVMTRVTEYNAASIDNQTILASKGKEAFYNAATFEVDRVLHAVTNSVGQAMFRSGWGELGTILAVNGTSFTLTNPSDGCNFERNQRLVFSSALSTATLRSATSIKVTGVARGLTTTTITCDTALATPGGVAGDYVFKLGDRQNSASPTAVKPFGFEAWCPATAPGSGDSFCSVDRSLESRLYGQVLSGTAKPLSEVLIDAAAIVDREGGNLSHFFCNPMTYAGLQKLLTGQVEIDVETSNPNIGFKGLSVTGPNGSIAVVADRNCPQNRVFGLELDSWKLRSLGGVPRIIDTDGLMYLRTGTADSITVQVGAYYQIACSAPSHNINIQI